MHYICSFNTTRIGFELMDYMVIIDGGLFDFGDFYGIM